MKNVFVMLAAFTVAACANMSSADMKMQNTEAIDYCLQEAERLTGQPLSSEADQAYLYKTEDGYWINFTHGALGTFGERSINYRVILSCAVLASPQPKLVYLGRPLKDPIVSEPERERFVDPIGTTEVLFKREGEKFRYCCEQPFDEGNIDRNNPNFPWKTDHVGP